MVLPSSRVYILNESVTGLESSNYLWDFGDGTTEVGYNPQPHNYDTDGVYTIELAIFNGHCPDTARQDIIVHPIWVGVNDHKKEAISIYPNPVKDKLSLSVGSLEVSEVFIIDLAGRKYTVSFTQSSEQKIDVSHLAKGPYILSVVTENKVLSSKFVKE